MKRYLMILILSIALVGCSNETQANIQDATATAKTPVPAKTPVLAKAPVESVQDNSNLPASNTEENTVENTEAEQLDKKEPVLEQGENLELPSVFPYRIVPIMENANITSTYVDGESISIVYQTKLSFDVVVRQYKDSMKSAKIMMEDSKGNSYYTINGTKEGTNIFIVVTPYMQDFTLVNINTNQYDLTAVDQGKEIRDQSKNIVNEPDYTPIVLQDPTICLPPPLELYVERQSTKTISDGMVIDVYVNEKPSDLGEISNDVIFKQSIMPTDSASTYQVGYSIPAVFDMIESDNVAIELEVKGTVQFRGIKYYVAEVNYIADIKLLDDGHEYAPNSEKIKFQVYIPHIGDQYWFVAWNAREIYSINYPKYLIQAEGLDILVDKD